MKRANGTGSIYKRSDDKRRRKPWVVVVNLGMDPLPLNVRKKSWEALRLPNRHRPRWISLTASPKNTKQPKLPWAKSGRSSMNRKRKQTKIIKTMTATGVTTSAS